MFLSLRFFVVFIVIVLRVDCDQTIWFAREIQANVLPLLERAYKILHDRFVVTILNIDPAIVGIDVNKTKDLIINLTCNAQEVSASLYRAVDACNNVDQQLNEKFAWQTSTKMSTESSMSEAERKLSVAASNVNYALENIVYIERVIQLMNTGIWPSEPIIIPANHFVTLCLPGSADPATCQQVKNHYYNLLNHYRDEHATVQREREALFGVLAQSSKQLDELKAQLHITARLISELRLSNKIISLIAIQSITLINALESLQDFEALVNPLNAVYSTMHANKIVLSGFNDLITSEQIAQVESNLAKLKSLVETLLPFDIEIVDPNC